MILNQLVNYRLRQAMLHYERSSTGSTLIFSNFLSQWLLYLIKHNSTLNMFFLLFPITSVCDQIQSDSFRFWIFLCWCWFFRTTYFLVDDQTKQTFTQSVIYNLQQNQNTNCNKKKDTKFKVICIISEKVNKIFFQVP